MRRRRSSRGNSPLAAVCVNPGKTKARLASWLDACTPLFEALAGAGFADSLVHVSLCPEMAGRAASMASIAARPSCCKERALVVVLPVDHAMVRRSPFDHARSRSAWDGRRQA